MLQVINEAVHLPFAGVPKQGEMYADTVQGVIVWQTYSAMKQASALKFEVGDVLVEGFQDRVAGKYGVTMVPVVVDHVFTIGGIRPDAFCEKGVLCCLGPFRTAAAMPQVQALDFLQKYDVRPQALQSFAQLMHHHPPIELGETLVDIVGGDVQGQDQGVASLRK